MGNNTVKKPATGFSLIEIMVALVLSSVILIGVFTIMTSSKRTYALQAELAKLQENARFAMEEIAYNLRMAGYAGCSQKLPTNAPGINLVDRGIVEFNNQNGRYTRRKGSTIDSTPKLSSQLTITFLDGELAPSKNIYNLQELLPGLYSLVKGNEPFLDPNDPVTVDRVSKMMDPNNIYPQELFLSNCRQAIRCAPNENRCLLKNLMGNLTTGNPRIKITYPFRGPIQIFSATNSIVFEVGFFTKDNGQKSFGLFSSTDNSNYDLLIEGVRAMNIDQRDNPIAPEAKPVVDIELLMRTTEPRYDIGSQAKTLNLGGFPTFKPEEGYRYRLWLTSVYLRNNK